MFHSRPLAEGVQKHGATSGQVHGSIFGIVCLGSHVSGALWPGVEASGLVPIKNCALIVSASLISLLFKLQRLREPGAGKFCVPFCTRGISLLTSAP